ncbi:MULTISPECIES: glutamate-5-semialdehyde dehydrogenase [Psychrobacter]|jgi:glutamate-5-semialdehyde dehydrogenase|uniref:Gamma-glutamyl phosphate reductase n=2 Tax=Psychrobacter TaxID=497 RepID=A0A1G6UBA4_9GAMM|nr:MULTISPECIES: glutamate-5-semialdehyde dehydrogenase [Psychrobacter]HBD04205.1 glutamate-5-semialdehyde dehydrogenase [Psychrobacter sp.]AOY43814.1 gamma-glutamyl phosphate reductase [Psychrobacter sp. AntiMn-1]MDH4903976.1 glutamate-5-semialdehyde dehydrogenase [Psychrobacter pocilloporae]SDD38593.1 glutamate-5-semialdehyde dehydrogenase [Psychrobacter pacificensis]GLR30278.1 gamma-glutamyl phosphate reductase [Psychrobacter pacificensis]|tara:strand:- start:383 stop:1684 length:1302 start_codon:yes stop_codon:yes gene_type:complete
MSQANTTDITTYMQSVGKQARAASRALAAANTGDKNSALMAIHDELVNAKPDILAANKIDMDNGHKNELDSALLDRLELNEARFNAMLQGLKDVASLPDPIGEVTDMTYQPSGIHLGKMRVPLGVVGMIYESRPNVTLEAASLALKSGNAIILRGGSEAFESNQAIAKCIIKGLSQTDLSEHSVQVLQTTDRAAVGELITMTEYVDVIVPRGGKGLIERISNDARVPVIKHLDGNCHTFIDSDADPEIAIKVSVNAKTHRYGTCNTMETLLIDASIAKDLLPKIATAIIEADDAMQLRVDESAESILADVITLNGHLSAATSEDWDTEYLAPILAVKVVDGIDEAIEHINTHGSHHTDVIITDNYTKSQRFIREVDSASVMINASSRFADGFEYGLGAEIGISTDKIHARGPVGLEGLTSQKWIVYGHGEVRA